MTTGTGVSARTETALREAMARLFAGMPTRTDGRLTKDNLAKEAGVSPATMFRAKDVLADWDAHTAAHGALTPGEARRDTAIHDLHRKLAQAKREITELHQQLAAATTVIAALHHDNQLLRAEHTTAGTVTVLPPRPPMTAAPAAVSTTPYAPDQHR
ncbi:MULTISPECIES: hypothetical protein [unclassified Streptomyces]|uniref:hypothetical protein n=1 Tax=unclassified Streptomyces TaxID=2593676 RepID=UPI00163D4EC6|nr:MULTISPECIES: hypothetical protein [unclassified Streptomyces]